jgi:hypothetical protein
VLPNRLLALAASTGLLLGSLGLSGLTGASAHVAPASTSTSSATSPLRPTPPAGSGWIQGWAVDRAGKPHLDIVVEAYRPGDLRNPVATALSYAGSNVHGDEVDGFFRLQVPEGRFVLRLASMPGATDPFRTLWFGRKAPVRMAGGVAEVGDVALTRVRKVEPRTLVTLDRTRIKQRRRGFVRVTVTHPEVVPVTGKVRVTVDRKALTTLELRNGASYLELPRLGLGTHRVSVQFLGNEAVLAGATASTVLSVVRR